MRTRTAPALLALFILFAASQTVSGAETFKIDSGHSQVGFKIRHFVSKVPGRFDRFKGTITLDPNDPATAKIAVEIDVASIDTDDPERDEHLKGEDFFEVVKHPKMAFVSTAVVAKGPGKAVMRGDFTMHGVTKPIELDVDILGFMDGRNAVRAGFEARGTINRKDFGMIWNRLLDQGGTVLGDEVEISLNIEAIREKPKAEPKPEPAPAPKNR